MPSPPEPSPDLIRRARNGDREAFGAIWELVRPELEVFLRAQGARNLGPRESVDDLTQSVCGECLQQLHGFEDRGAGSFRAWLRRVALHKLIDKHRLHTAARRDRDREGDQDPADAGLRPLRETLHQLPSPSQSAIRSEELDRLERALQCLPEDQRQVVTMSRLLQMSHAEIAAVLDRSEGACRMLLSRGMVALAGLLDDDEARD